MPSRAHLMVKDGDTAHPGDVLAKIPRETTKTKDITGGLPRVGRIVSKRRKPHETAVISEIDGTVKFGEVSKGQRKMYVVADNGTEKEYSGTARRSHQRAGRRTGQSGRTADGWPAQPARHPGPCSAKRKLQSYLVNEIQEVYRLAGREHQRQAHRSDRSPDDALAQGGRRGRYAVPAGTADRQVPLCRRERTRDCAGWTSGNGPAAAPGYHQGFALKRLVHFGGVRSRRQRAS